LPKSKATWIAGALAAELEAARETLRAMSALLPVCPACGKPRDRAEGHTEDEIAALARACPELAGTLCADCGTNGAKAVPATPAGSSAA
jgi:ribosomal protein L32